ncbi:hypothetical protein [Paradesulfitobacterium ferrireducens]|uniref:hypothetical protein n=1 Tax=Paradesulfitobacterium ferrireducens TaxID=2816476 RepID=UPI001A8D1193|nr:hypothetical protein [Paradesulfitobacterium ferrireducens]
MKVKVIIACLVTVALVGVWWALTAAKAGSTGSNALSGTGTAQTPAPVSQANPVIDEQGGIQVVVKWERQDAQAGMQKFRIELNNHALNLDGFDFSRNLKLQLDGIEIPASIKAANTSGEGHHVSAEITAQASELTKLKTGSRLSIILENVGNTQARTFSWVY